MSTSEAATKVARDYYNSSDADLFYARVWGGEDIHVGMYLSSDESIRIASRRTVEHLGDQLKHVAPTSRILDLGSGYGGAARYLAERFGCHVTCLNLSEVENARNRELNQESGLDSQIDVIDGSFEQIPCDDSSFDFIWSQDAILHAGNRFRVFQEVDRVLRSPGQFVMTDPMRSDDCPLDALQPVLDRLHLEDLGSPAVYLEYARKLSWQCAEFSDHTAQLVQHYTRVLATTESMEGTLQQEISSAYLDRMKQGLARWIDSGKQGHLTWGVFQFRK